jgi:hypothetical protein
MQKWFVQRQLGDLLPVPAAQFLKRIRPVDVITSATGALHRAL